MYEHKSVAPYLAGQDAWIAYIVWFMKLPIMGLKLLAAVFIINTML